MKTIVEFNICLYAIGNNYFSLGEKISEEKRARKILRSLTKRFDMKVIAFEEAQDVGKLKVDELIGFLLTF